MGIYDREYLRDEDQPQGLRLVFGSSAVTTLIVLNVAVALADMFSDHHWLNDQLSVWSFTLKQPWRLWEFLTYGFAHNPDNLNHIIFNMIGLWCFGSALEERYGKKEFLCFYLTAIVLGGVAWSARATLSQMGVMGALRCSLRGLRGA